MPDLSELVNQVFGAAAAAITEVKETAIAVAPGLSDFVPEAKAELGRLGVQGQMELASAIFGNGAFVPYGPGQYTPQPEQAPDHGLGNMRAEPQQQQQRGAMSM